MAKQPTIKKDGFNFSKISGIIENLSKKSMITIDNLRSERTYINTGIYILNALLSKSILHGGIATNRFTILAGPSQTGKSYICLNVVRNAQKEGYNIIYIDTEFSIENSDFDMFGIDTTDSNKFVLIRSNKVENLKVFLAQLLNELKKLKEKGEDLSKTLFVIDSLGALASNKEMEDAIKGDNKQDMSRAKSIKSLLRIIIDDLGYLSIPLLATNHIYLCLTGDNEIMKSDGNSEKISNIKLGDSIKTLDGDKLVLNNFIYEKSQIMEIELDNGDIIKCTPNHKFLVNEKWNSDENDNCWKQANELNENDFILQIMEKNKKKNIIKLRKIKIKSIKKSTTEEKTYDLLIEGSHHYILKNGVVSHNSMDLFPQAIQSGGESLNYLASTIVLLSKAKLADNDKDEMSTGAVGLTITALARKNRLAKPKKIKFEIDHSKGCNPFKGLEQFCTVENFEKVGIAKVKPVVDKKTGEITYVDASKWYVKHIDKTLFDSQLYNGKVFTKEVLDALEPIIYDYFRYSSYDEYQKEMEIMDEKYADFEQDVDFEIDDDNIDDKLFS